MKFLIVGGGSNLGRPLRTRLSSLGHDVIATSRHGGDGDIFFDLQTPENEWPVWPEKIHAAFIASAITRQDECTKDPDKARFINIEQTTLLIEQFIRLGIHVIYPSTNIVLACNQPNQPLDAPLAPQGIYAETKAEIEQNFHHHPDVGISRLSKILDGQTGILKTWREKSEKGETIEAFDDLFIAPVSLSYAVHFLSELMIRKSGGLWHLSGNEELSYFRLAERMARMPEFEGMQVVPSKMPASMAAASPRHPSLDMSETIKKIGIQPQNPEEMLRDCFKTTPTSP